MKRFPPLIWPLMSLAYLFLLMGLSHWQWEEILVGTAAALVVLGVAAYLSTRGHDQEGRPRPPRMGLALGGIAAFYLVCAGVASIAGAKYGAVALLAGVVPASAAMLLIATMRAKTAATTDRPRDSTAAASGDALPGIGMDDETPLGDTPEHSDAERTAEPDRRFERRRADVEHRAARRPRP